jgi:uncharacterized protein (TIRG00374 family)
MKKFLIGLTLAVILIYLSLKNIDYRSIFMELQKVNYKLLVLTVPLFVFIQFLRSVRWGIILSPIEKIKQNKLFPITCVGFMAIALVPMRTGELLRPYLISKRSTIPFSSAVATILIERILDSVILTCILALIVSKAHFIEELRNSITIFLLTFAILLILVYLFYFRKETFLFVIRRALSHFPEKARFWAEDLFKLFVEGFKLIKEPRKFAYALTLSIIIWVLSGLAISILLPLVKIQLPLMGAFVVLLVTVMVISLPTAPGFLGNFQFGCIVALSFYNVAKENAFAFSMVYYIVGIGTNILLGIIFLPFRKFPLKKFKRNP